MNEPTRPAQPPEDQIDELWNSLRRHVVTRLRAADDADDIVQDAWLKLLSHPPEQRDRVRGWLRVVADRLVLEGARRRGHRLHRERATARAESERALEPVPDEHGLVVRLLDELEDPYRSVVRLRFFDELETSEIAARLGRSEATVRSQIKRGLDQLRARLGVPTERNARANARLRRLLGLLPFGSARHRPGARVAPDRLRRALLPAAAGLFGTFLIVVKLQAPDRLATPLGERSGSLLVESGPGRTDPGATIAAAERTRADAGIVSNATDASPADAPPPAAGAFAIRGRVLSRGQATPIEGMRILAARDPRASPEIVALSGADGRFTASVAELPLWIGAEDDAHSPTRRKRVDEGFLLSGEELLLESLRTGVFRGLVVDPSGAPVVGAEVRVGGLQAVERELRGAQGLLELPAGPRWLRTDAEGGFACPLRDAARAQVEVADHGLGVHRFLVQELAGEHRFVLDGASRIEANERADVARAAADALPAGNGVLSGRLSLPGSALRRPGIDLRLRSKATDATVRATLDQDLRFEFESLPHGRFELTLEGGGAHGAWTVAELRLARGEVRDLGTIVVPPPGGLRIRTSFAASRPPAGIKISLTRPGFSLRMHLDESGTGLLVDEALGVVELQRIWPGTYIVGIHGQELTDDQEEVTIRSEHVSELALDPAPGGPVVLRLRFPYRPTPEEIVQVDLHSADGVETRMYQGIGKSIEVDDLGSLHLGLPDVVERIELRTSSGLTGGADLPPRHGVHLREVAVRLDPPADSGD